MTVAADRFRDARGVDHSVDLALSTLGTGEYLLIVETTAGEFAARRGVRFSVR